MLLSWKCIKIMFFFLNLLLILAHQNDLKIHKKINLKQKKVQILSKTIFHCKNKQVTRERKVLSKVSFEFKLTCASACLCFEPKFIIK
jgi:hypothetical protein